MAQTFDFDIGSVVGPPGATGNGIKSIQLLSTSGLSKTYRITMTDDTTFDFTVTDGNGITNASLDNTTYQLTLTFSNGTSYTTPPIRGEQGDDGVSPEVTVTTITGGHRVTITDKDHPQGQSFDVMDGQGGGGTSDYTDLTNKPQINGHTLTGNQTAAQLGLATPSDIPTVPVQSVAGKTGAVTLDGGDVGFSDSATYQAGSVGAELQEQNRHLSDKADKTIYQNVTGTTLTLAPAVDNTMYLCGELTELTVTAPATGIFAVRFTSGSTPTVATFTGVTWLNGFDPTAIEASKTYEINILNGLGCAAWT